MGALLSVFWTARCGLAYLFSGFDYQNTATYPLAMNAETSQQYPWTGEWLGADGITEYLGGFGSRFATGIQMMADPTVSFGESSVDACQVTAVAPVRLITKAPYSPTEVCIDFVGANRIRMELNGFFFPSILVTNWDIWTDDTFAKELFTALDSTATTDYVCDVLVNTCGEPNLDMDTCITQFNTLPTFDNELWIDGNSRSCRGLHAVYSQENTAHCPHVSFAEEADSNGLIKCYNTKQTRAEDLFTPEEIAAFKATTLPYASSNPYLAVHPNGACPSI